MTSYLNLENLPMMTLQVICYDRYHFSARYYVVEAEGVAGVPYDFDIWDTSRPAFIKAIVERLYTLGFPDLSDLTFDVQKVICLEGDEYIGPDLVDSSQTLAFLTEVKISPFYKEQKAKFKAEALAQEEFLKKEAALEAKTRRLKLFQDLKKEFEIKAK